MRHLALTSPEMRGQDIRILQHVLNERLTHYRSRTRLQADGIYGRATAHAVADVAYAEGLEHFDGSTPVLELILHPHLRQPAQFAREMKRAHERAQHKGGTLASIPEIALKYLGVHESPDGSNWGYPHPAEWEQEFGFGGGVSWCGCFAGAMIRLAGGHVSSRVAFCPYIEADARSRTDGFEEWRSNHSEGVGPGWLVLFNWVGGSEPEHVEIVRSVHPEYLVTIGGNTGGHGGEVATQQRPYNVTLGYAKPRL